MKIADVCTALQILAERQSSSEMSGLVTGLRRFDDLSVHEFVELLSETDERRQSASGTEKVDRKRLPKIRKIDEEKVSHSVARVRQMLDRITADVFDYAAIDVEMAEIDDRLSRDEIFEVASRLKVYLNPKMNRKEAIAEIDEMVRGLRRSFERNSGRMRHDAAVG